MRKPPRWDLHAERYAAAVTLYELATGTLPKWGDGTTDPSHLSRDCEITIDTELFDPALRELLTGFFTQALRRNIDERFDDAGQMLRSWRQCFEWLEGPSPPSTKVYILHNEIDSDRFLTIKTMYFTEQNREAARDHVQQETGADFVWFEDEEPPIELTETVLKASDQQEGDRYGFAVGDWIAAKEEMRQAMISRARLRGMISYSDLCKQVTTIAIEPHSYALTAMLAEISFAEDAVGRGMLTAIVVPEDGDMEPWPGFFEMAQELGRDISECLLCWAQELNMVYSVWS